MSRFDRISMWVYSGTGNSLAAARWFAEEADGASVDARVQLVDHRTTAAPPDGERVLLGFLYSTHGFCVPWTMLKLIARLPRCGERDAAAFLLNTRGGLKLGPLLLPGLTGVALLLPALMLWAKGYRVVGTRPLDMPSSWHQLHPALTGSAVSAICERRHQQVRVFAGRLLGGGRAFHGFWTLPVDLSLVPVTILYLALGRYGLAKMQMASANCDACRICEKHCPVGAIEIRDGRPYWKLTCESCMRCYSLCPQRAVQCAHSYSVLGFLPFVVLIPLIHGYAWPWITGLAPALVPLGVVGYGIFWFAFTFAITVAGYWLLHAMLRYRPINHALNYTSLTRLFRRHLAPGVTGKHLRRPRKKSPPGGA